MHRFYNFAISQNAKAISLRPIEGKSTVSGHFGIYWNRIANERQNAYLCKLMNNYRIFGAPICDRYIFTESFILATQELRHVSSFAINISQFMLF